VISFMAFEYSVQTMARVIHIFKKKSYTLTK